MRLVFTLVISFLFAFLFNSCGCSCGDCSCDKCVCHNCKPSNCKCVISDTTTTTDSITYNIFYENSGSMKGYVCPPAHTLITILKEYHDRIKENLNAGDTITLNYINNKIEQSPNDIESYLLSLCGKSNASYTKLGNILAMSMDSLKENSVNILVSDFCFTTDNNLAIETARSEITKLFAERLKKNKDISIAIVKYDCDFDGKYYPGGIPCKQSLPIYIWVFGLSDCVKTITRLPIKEDSGRVMMFQPWQELQPKYIVKNARMLDKKDNSIIVKNWDKDRRDKKKYKLAFKIDTSSILLDEEHLMDSSQYSISPRYTIDSIAKQGDDICFNISTEHPSPGNVEINLNYNIPGWVEMSNFSEIGVPPKGQTLNVKYLIEGVYDAYHNKSNKYLTVNLKLK